MQLVTAATAGFLLAVLWFDLMFDVQVRGHRGGRLPTEILESISDYYRRVTIEATPMNRLVALAMLGTLTSIVVGIARGAHAGWPGWGSLLAAVAAIAPALLRTVPNARRLGAGKDSPEVQSTLARAIHRDHRFSFVCMSIVLALQLVAS